MAIDTGRGSLRTQLLFVPPAAETDGSRNPHAALAAAAAFVNTLSLNYLVGQERSIADQPGETLGRRVCWQVRATRPGSGGVRRSGRRRSSTSRRRTGYSRPS